MRSAAICVLLALIHAAVGVASDHKKVTEAESDGLVGPVKSVMTRSTVSNPLSRLLVPSMPGSTVFAIPCWVCEYDKQGTRVLSGTKWDDRFIGESRRNVYDEAGNLLEQLVHDEQGNLVRHMFFGPSGLVRMESYQNGRRKVTQTVRYNESDRTKVTITREADGAQTGRSKQRFGDHGQVIEAWSYGPNNLFLSHYTNIVDEEKVGRR